MGKRKGVSSELETIYAYFAEACGWKSVPTERGREQFFEFDTYGKKPPKPDPYYDTLLRGKDAFHLWQTTTKGLYYSGEWWGWYSYWLDWKGHRWMLRHLMKWHPKPPAWLYEEDESLVEPKL